MRAHTVSERKLQLFLESLCHKVAPVSNSLHLDILGCVQLHSFCRTGFGSHLVGSQRVTVLQGFKAHQQLTSSWHAACCLSSGRQTLPRRAGWFGASETIAARTGPGQLRVVAAPKAFSRSNRVSAQEPKSPTLRCNGWVGFRAIEPRLNAIR